MWDRWNRATLTMSEACLLPISGPGRCRIVCPKYYLNSSADVHETWYWCNVTWSKIYTTMSFIFIGDTANWINLPILWKWFCIKVGHIRCRSRMTTDNKWVWKTCGEGVWFFTISLADYCVKNSPSVRKIGFSCEPCVLYGSRIVPRDNRWLFFFIKRLNIFFVPFIWRPPLISGRH